MRRDLDDVIQGWPYDPEPGEHLAREVRARDGRMVLQVRIELGVLQLEVGGRPDGLRPHGFNTYLDYLRHNAASRGLAPGGKSPPWMMTAHQCAEADREFIQFYHRRIAWLALRRHEKAIQDADHTLALMDFVRRHVEEEDYIASHEQFRGIVLFHRTEAAIAVALERHRPEEAIDALRDGVERLTTHQRTWWEEHEPADSPNPHWSINFGSTSRISARSSRWKRPCANSSTRLSPRRTTSRQPGFATRSKLRIARGGNSYRDSACLYIQVAVTRGSMNQPRPVDKIGGDDRSFDAHSAEVGRTVGLANRRNATEARTEAARHVVFQ